MTTPRFFIGNQIKSAARPLLGPWEFALEQGLESFEWYSDKSHDGWGEKDFDAATRQKIRSLATERGMRLSVHAPYVADPYERAGTEAIYRSLDFAAAVGAAVVNIHLFPNRGLDTFVRVLTPLLCYAASAGVKISIENTPETTPDQFNQVFAQLQSMPVAQDRVGMCFDMGHANLCQATRNDFLSFLDQLDRHVPILHWHAHENWGDRDSHLPLFTGPAAEHDGGIRGLVRRLKERGFVGSVVMETWPDPPEVLLQARDRLREIIAGE